MAVLAAGTASPAVGQQVPTGTSQVPVENRSFYICAIAPRARYCDPSPQVLVVGQTLKIRVRGLDGRDGTRVNIYRRTVGQSQFVLWKSPLIEGATARARFVPRRQGDFEFMARIRQGTQPVETNYMRVSVFLDAV